MKTTKQPVVVKSLKTAPGACWCLNDAIHQKLAAALRNTSNATRQRQSTKKSVMRLSRAASAERTIKMIVEMITEMIAINRILYRGN